MLHGLNMAENVMVELAKKGVGRQQAHEIMRQASMKAFEEKRELADVLLEQEVGHRSYSSPGDQEPARPP